MDPILHQISGEIQEAEAHELEPIYRVRSVTERSIESTEPLGSFRRTFASSKSYGTCSPNWGAEAGSIERGNATFGQLNRPVG